MAKCRRCDGCGKIANDSEGTPWSFWEALPPGSDMAVKMGVVKPIECPDCRGTGDHPNPLEPVASTGKVLPFLLDGHLARVKDLDQDLADRLRLDIEAVLTTHEAQVERVMEAHQENLQRAVDA